MGLSLSGVQRFQKAAQKVMEELFPGTVTIAGQSYAAACVGGSGIADYAEGGRVVRGVRFFRVRKDLLVTPPKVGTALVWVRTEGGEEIRDFMVLEVADRPHETAWMLRCEPKRR